MSFSALGTSSIVVIDFCTVRRVCSLTQLSSLIQDKVGVTLGALVGVSLIQAVGQSNVLTGPLKRSVVLALWTAKSIGQVVDCVVDLRTS